eukprot:16437733-Heterocapsa_arctica.AAC.1
MPPKQLRLDRLWGRSGGRATPDDGEVAIAAAVASINVGHAAKEVDMEHDATNVGMQFVNNGSRDRFGQQRQNCGGRPKNVHPAEGLASNRRVAGKVRRKEFGAKEKIQMIMKAKQLDLKIRTEHPGSSEEMLVKLVQQAIGK